MHKNKERSDTNPGNGQMQADPEHERHAYKKARGPTTERQAVGENRGAEATDTQSGCPKRMHRQWGETDGNPVDPSDGDGPCATEDLGVSVALVGWLENPPDKGAAGARQQGWVFGLAIWYGHVGMNGAIGTPGRRRSSAGNDSWNETGGVPSHSQDSRLGTILANSGSTAGTAHHDVLYIGTHRQWAGFRGRSGGIERERKSGPRLGAKTAQPLLMQSRPVEFAAHSIIHTYAPEFDQDIQRPESGQYRLY
ncbi:hypothetical protein C8R43DRAFT_961013 [Mycena crocata]|nr:hypothetical protein C8R43DRAFT_961013 [Mycena crocata]